MKAHLKKHPFFLSAVILFQIISTGLILLGAVFEQRLVDTLLLGSGGQMWRAVWALAAFSVCAIWVYIISQIIEARFTTQIIGELRSHVFGGILHRDVGQYMENDPADMLSAMTNDVATIKNRFFSMFFMILVSVAGLVFSAALMFAYQPLVALAAVVTSVLMMFVPMLAGNRMAVLEKGRSEQFAAYTAKIKDMVEGFEVIASFGVQRIILGKFRKENQALVRAENSVEQFSAATNAIAQAFSVFSGILMLTLCAYLVSKGQMTVGALTIFISLKTSFSSSLSVLLQAVPVIRGLKPVSDRLNALAQSEAKTGGIIEPAFEKQIRLEHVRYAYQPEQWTLNDIGYTFEKSRKYVIIGKNGSGETTLLRLLSGYFTDYEGGIFFDGTEMQKLDRRKLHRLIAVIHQNVFLFNDTIENNITLGETFPPEKMERALKISGVADFAAHYADGLSHPVGEAGHLLSGGQRQRIAVARALVRDTPLFILDEGTSAIDEKTAVEIEDQLFHVPGLTLIAVAHHLSAERLRRYDEVLVLQDGKIAQWENEAV